MKKVTKENNSEQLYARAISEELAENFDNALRRAEEWIPAEKYVKFEDTCEIIAQHITPWKNTSKRGSHCGGGRTTQRAVNADFLEDDSVGDDQVLE